MLQNYIKIAFRNLLKHKSFSFINIFGLAASLSVCLLCIMLIKDAHNYDKFHPESDQVYRIITTPVRKDGGTEQYATSPFIVGQALKENYSQVELWTPLVRTFRSNVRKNDNLISGSGLFTDGSFFEMFGFELEAGDPNTALADPYSVVVTKEFAERIFKNSDPIGQELEMPAYETKFKVTGVLAEFPGKTHMEFDALGSISTQIALDKLPDSRNVTGTWTDYYTAYNFIRLKEGEGKASLGTALADISNTQYEDLVLESRDRGYNFHLQALDAITPGTIYSNSMGNAFPVQVLWFFSLLSIIVVLSACFNYTNLSIARSLTRAKEVGVRKVMGASRRQVFGQFISEALLVSLFALGLGYLMLEFLIPGFNSLQLFASSDVSFEIDTQVVALFFAFSIVIGLIAGTLPAFVLSKFSPLSVMQKLENVKLFRRIGLRKALIVFQFSISLTFILVLSIAWKQLDFAVTENFGADREDVVNVTMFGNSYNKLATAFSQLPQVENVSASSHLMGTWQDGKVDIRVNAEDEKIAVRDYVVDHHYIQNFNLEIIAGEDFPENPSQQQEVFAIVNENFLETFGLGSANEAIGQALILEDSTRVSVKGVLKDFLYKPLVYNLEPLLLRYNPKQLSVMHLTVNDANIPATVAALERAWKQVDPERDLTYNFYDEAAAETFVEMKEVAKVIGYFGTLGIIIACLGLLGMAIYSVETKAKEISIRKVIGASAMDLINQLSKGYALLLLIAILVAVPASFLIGSQLLQSFAYSISLSAWVFVPGVAALVILGMVTIGSQTIRAAFANPVENLKDD